MHHSRFQSITSRFSPHNLRTSFRRSLSSSSASSSSSRESSTNRGSWASSHAGSPAGAGSSSSITTLRQKAGLDQHDEDERPPHILEPRPAATFCSLEERMMSF